jgi:hypothetical protein
MMMFHFYIVFLFALLLTLISLSMGTGILFKAKKYEEMHKVGGLRFIGYLVVILSFIILISLGICATKFVIYQLEVYKNQAQPMMQNQMMPMMNRQKSTQQMMPMMNQQKSMQQNMPMMNQQSMPTQNQQQTPQKQ